MRSQGSGMPSGNERWRSDKEGSCNGVQGVKLHLNHLKHLPPSVQISLTAKNVCTKEVTIHIQIAEGL
jgi:hypothetical protein